jgi:hypothetical protein
LKKHQLWNAKAAKRRILRISLVYSRYSYIGVIRVKDISDFEKTMDPHASSLTFYEACGVQLLSGEEMKKITVTILAMILLTSCNGWFFQPSPYTPPTPFLPPTNTPSILSPTPVVIGVSSATPMVATMTAVPSSTPFTAITNTPIVVATDTPIGAATNTALVPMPNVSAELLGCSTSIDVTHGMGEVTDAYVTLRNTGNVDLTNIRATLFARDEGREHPDKTIELTILPVNYQVTIKLTADSTYQEETPIQIEVAANGIVFPRVGGDSCRDIGLFAPRPDSLMTPIPVP